jgi:hypothetical protein
MGARYEAGRPIAVLDTSVLVPVWSRLALRQLAMGRERRYRPIWSEWIIAETWYVLADRAAREGTDRALVSSQAKQMLRYFLSAMGLVSVAIRPLAMPRSPFADPDDEAIWVTSIIGNAQYIVSHNTSDFPPLVEETIAHEGRTFRAQRHLYEGVEFLTAIEFIEDVLGEDAAAALRRPLPARGVIRSRRAVVPA